MRALPADVPYRHAGPAHLPVPAGGVAAVQPLRPPHDVSLVPHAGLVQRHAAEELTSSSPGCTVGSRRVRARAISATRARTARAARSPLIRLCAFSATTASAVFGGTSAFCRAALRSASLTNGMPEDSSTCAWEDSSFGMAGFEATDPRKVVVSTAMRIAPDKAVPIDAPRFVTVFCTPPTSPLWE